MPQSLFSNINPRISSNVNLDVQFVKWLQDNLDWAKHELNSRLSILDIQVPNAATPGTLVETQLYGYTIPAGNLISAGYSFRSRFYGTTSGNGNGKTVRAYLGATKIFDSGAFSGASKDWVVDLAVNFSGAATQECIANGVVNGNAAIVTFTHTLIDMTADQLFKVTGQNAVAAAADLTLKGLQIEIGKSPLI